MRVILQGYSLDNSGIDVLRKLIAGPERSNKGVEALLEHVHELDATYVVVESDYTDQDYSADYGAFYAGAFKDHPRVAKRVHFFTSDVSSILTLPFPNQQAALDEEGSYLGFVVVRPIRQGPLGRTALPFPKNVGAGHIVRPAARADFDVHLRNVKLKALGCAPFIQQDTRVGACAQAAIWMASRAVFARHKRTAWHSVAEITQMAITPRDPVLSQSLPAGSGGLNPAHIVRALGGMGHQPLFDFFGDAGDATAKPRGGKRAVSAAAEPAAAGAPATAPKDPLLPPAPSAIATSLRYLDSGLPVILGLGDILHAVTAVGFVEAIDGPCRSGDTFDIFVRALIVHDDQAGPYRLLPVDPEDAAFLQQDRLMKDAAGRILSVKGSVTHMFVPLPSRVYLSGNDADEVAQDYLLSTAKNLWPNIALVYDAALGPEKAKASHDFAALVTDGKLIRRTYLTSAGRYRHHLARSGLVDRALTEAITRVLPHFVWVTELISPEDAKASPDNARTILGHMVVNATSSTDPDLDLLMIHAPYTFIHRDINPGEDAPADFREDLIVLDDNAPYRGRCRKS